MILVTGATGFVGRVLLPRLAESGQEIKVLLRPSRQSPRLPKGLSVNVSIASLTDERSLRSALAGVDMLIHLAGAEWRGARSDVLAVDGGGTRTLMEAAKEAGVGRVLYLSHLGADRASAYPVLKAKGIAEEFIRQSGVPFTILRSAILFGQDDVFFNTLAAMLKFSPGVFLMPGDGRVTLQPLWVEDLATCVEWSLNDPSTLNQTYAIGGPDFITFEQIITLLMDAVNAPRAVVQMRQPYLRAGAWFFERVLPRSPLTTHWLDYLAISRTCEANSVLRYFGLKPVRFSTTITYLHQKQWLAEAWRLMTV